MPDSKHHMDFLVIGAQKCATTWLYFCLKDHPGIHVPAKKKEVEYLGGDLFKQNGPEWYFGLVKDALPNQVVGDVSVNYLSDPESPPLVQQYLPDAKLITCLRDPIDRAISAYFWYMRKGKLPDLPLDMAFEQVLDPTKKQEPGVREVYDDLLYRSKYDIQLARYRAFVAPEHMHYILQEEVKADPRDVLSRTFRYLKVDDTFVPESMNSAPKQNTYFKPLIALERLAPKSQIVSKIADMTNQFLNKGKQKEEKPKLRHDLTTRLIKIFEPHIIETQRIINESRTSSDQVDLVSIWVDRWKA